MKPKLLTVTLIAIGISINISTAHAATCTQVACPADKIPTLSSTSQYHCLNNEITFYCYYDRTGSFKGPYITCMNGCQSGYTLKAHPQWQTNVGVGCNTTQLGFPIQCLSNSELCGTCDSTAWTEIPSIPYATRTQKWCDGATCKSQSQVGCKKGYYGTPTSVGSGCTRCPKIPDTADVYGTTGAIGATDISACYVPSGTAFSDSTGNGIYTTDTNGIPCYYTK